MSLELISERRLCFELRPSAALVAYAQLLAVSSGEVERLVERELSENPALERAESPPQPRMPGWMAAAAPREPAHEPGVLARLARDARASLPRADHPALDFLLGSIDDRGFLTVEPEVVARAVGAPLERVRAVHALVRELGPLGFASRDIRDCLDAQLDQLAADPQLVALARRIVASSLDDLAAGRYGALSRRLGVDRARVVAVRDLIRARLRPFPVLDAPLRGGPEPPTAPDIIVEVACVGAADRRCARRAHRGARPARRAARRRARSDRLRRSRRARARARARAEPRRPAARAGDRDGRAGAGR